MPKKKSAESELESIEYKVEGLKAPFGYYGCKQRLSAKIVNDLPPHNAWVEALCGSAAVTLAKKPAPIEVINDIDGEIINFFRQLRDNTSQLERVVRLTPYSRKELELARVSGESVNDLEKARRFFVRAMMAINGSFGEEKGGFSFSNSYSRGGMEARVCRWKSTVDYLHTIALRLSRVRIENKDAVKLFREFMDRPATLVYFDPPYLGNRMRGYDFDQTSVDYHDQLLRVILKAKCMVFISGYQSDLYDEYLSTERGWTKRIIEATTRGHNGKNANRQEILWFNMQYQKASRAGRVPIRLSEAEKRFKKLNPKRK
jgi:DNA adenine methylase